MGGYGSREDGGVSGGRGGGTGRTVEDLGEAGPEEVYQCDHRHDADRERDRSLPCLCLRGKTSAQSPTHDRETRTHTMSTAPTSTTTSRNHPTARRRMRPLPSRAMRQCSTRYSVKPGQWMMVNSGCVGRGRACMHCVGPASGFGRGKTGSLVSAQRCDRCSGGAPLGESPTLLSSMLTIRASQRCTCSRHRLCRSRGLTRQLAVPNLPGRPLVHPLI